MVVLAHPNITTHNQALLMKYLHKFLNKEDTAWVNIIWETYYSNCLPNSKDVGSFWWRDVLKPLPLYKEHAICIPGNGSTTYFWLDKWIDNQLQQTSTSSALTLRYHFTKSMHLTTWQIFFIDLCLSRLINSSSSSVLLCKIEDI